MTYVELVAEPAVTYLISWPDTPVSILYNVPVNETHERVLWTANAASHGGIQHL